MQYDIFDPALQAAIVKCVRDAMKRWYEQSLLHAAINETKPGKLEKYCLFWADTTRSALEHLGFRAYLQAGTTYWPYQPDDGSNQYQWGYEFRMDIESAMRAAIGHLPEMHCWCVVEPDIVIDLTTGYWPENAKEYGLKWTATIPPQVLWCKAEDLPGGVLYHADADAIKLAEWLLEKNRFRL